jgi:hypothetical protein
MAAAHTRVLAASEEKIGMKFEIKEKMEGRI